MSKTLLRPISKSSLRWVTCLATPSRFDSTSGSFVDGKNVAALSYGWRERGEGHDETPCNRLMAQCLLTNYFSCSLPALLLLAPSRNLSATNCNHEDLHSPKPSPPRRSDPPRGDCFLWCRMWTTLRRLRPTSMGGRGSFRDR